MDESTIQKVTELKDKGNAHLAKNENQQAIDCYTQAIELDPNNHILYSNRSAAYLKLQKYAQALADAELAIRHNEGWAKGYSRKAVALYYLNRLPEALEFCNKALSLDPDNSFYKTTVDDIQFAIKTQTIPSGVWFTMPLPLSDANSLNYPVVERMCHWAINKNCAGIITIGLGSEYNSLTQNNIVELNKKSTEYVKNRIPIMSYITATGSMDTIANQIKAIQETGVNIFIIPISSLSQNNLSHDIIIENINKLFDLIDRDSISIGLTDTDNMEITPDLLKKISDLKKIRIYIDRSGSITKKTEKFNSKGAHDPRMKIFNGNLTTLQHSLSLGYDGYIGEGTAFFSSLLCWFFKNQKSKHTDTIDLCQKFFSLSEPVVKKDFPFNARVYLKMHAEELKELEIISNLTNINQDALQEDGMRLSHLSDLVKYVWNVIKEEEKSKSNEKKSTIL